MRPGGGGKRGGGGRSGCQRRGEGRRIEGKEERVVKFSVEAAEERVRGAR